MNDMVDLAGRLERRAIRWQLVSAAYYLSAAEMVERGGHALFVIAALQHEAARISQIARDAHRLLRTF